MGYLDNMYALSRRKLLTLNQEEQKRLIQVYSDAGSELVKKYKRVGVDGLTKTYLREYTNSVYTELQTLIKECGLDAATIPADMQEFIMQDMAGKAKFNAKFHNLFSNVPTETMNAIIKGDIYKDGRGLSSRLWNYGIINERNIQDVVLSGMKRGESAVSMAKRLEMFVNPTARKQWSIAKQKEKLGYSYGNIEYNSLRLARTTNTHAATLSSKIAANKNPFVEGLQWHISAAHSTRMNGRTDECDERNEKVYSADKCPFDHPNGLCYQTPYIPKSIDEIADELDDWVNQGVYNPVLDAWYRDNANNIEIAVTKLESTASKINKIKEAAKSNKYGIPDEQQIKQAGNLVMEDLKSVRSDTIDKLIDLEGKLDKDGYKIARDERMNLSSVRRGFAEPEDYGFKNMEEVEKKIAEYDKIMEDYHTIEDKMEDLRYTIKGTFRENSDELKAKLSEFREVGSGNLNIVEHLKGAKNNIVEDAYNYYPTDWVKKSVAKSNLNSIEVDRGYYSDYNCIVAISGRSEKAKFETAVHELGHRMEKAVPKIWSTENKFYEERTVGEDLKWLGSGYDRDEKSRFDSFLDPYMGKYYDGSCYELVSMGFEMAYTDPVHLWIDEDFASYIYGLLAIM